jgi:hypothetical protein
MLFLALCTTLADDIADEDFVLTQILSVGWAVFAHVLVDNAVISRGKSAVQSLGWLGHILSALRLEPEEKQDLRDTEWLGSLSCCSWAIHLTNKIIDLRYTGSMCMYRSDWSGYRLQ